MLRKQRAVEDEGPPFLGTWPRVYAVVLGGLVVVVVLFSWFTAHFRP